MWSDCREVARLGARRVEAALRGPVVQRREVHRLREVERGEQPHRVHVLALHPQREVHDAERVLGTGAAGRADDGPAPRRCAAAHGHRREERHRRLQPAGVLDHDVQGARRRVRRTRRDRRRRRAPGCPAAPRGRRRGGRRRSAPSARRTGGRPGRRPAGSRDRTPRRRGPAPGRRPRPRGEDERDEARGRGAEGAGLHRRPPGRASSGQGREAMEEVRGNLPDESGAAKRAPATLPRCRSRPTRTSSAGSTPR